MKKSMLGVAASALLLAGAANASITLDPSGRPVVTPANTYEVFLSGASAPRHFIERLLTDTRVPLVNRVCRAPIYRFRDSAANNQSAYLCILNTANPALRGLAAGKTNLMIYKRDLGGSALGVSPIVANTPIRFLRVDPSICTVPAPVDGLSTSTCTYNEASDAQSQLVVPDFGVSDVDPSQFAGDNTPAGFPPVTAADLNRIVVRPSNALIFGMSVNRRLRDAMQAAQFSVNSNCHPAHINYAANAERASCMPTISSAQLASIFSGQITSWRQVRVGNDTNLFDNPTLPAALRPTGANADRMHICGRVQGSGTRAQFGIKFLNYPCTASAKPQINGDGDAITTNNPPEALNVAQVHNLSTAGNVDECLNDLHRGTGGGVGAFDNIYGTRWAIGYQGTDRNADNAHDWRFVRIDGVEPSLARVASGRYRDWVEMTFQYNRTHAFDTSELQIVEEVIKQAGNPVVMAVTNVRANHTWGQSGVMAVPQSFAPQANGRLNNARPVNPMSHGTPVDAPNACRAPALYSPATPASGFQMM